MIERTEQLSILRAAARSLARAEGAVIILDAPAGRGKSALLHAGLSDISRLHIRVSVARASHLDTAVPYGLLRRLVSPMVYTDTGLKPLDGASAFAAPLFASGAELTAGVAYGCHQLLLAEAEASPLVLAIDDAHWADPATLQVLSRVAADLEHQPMLIILAARPGQRGPAADALSQIASQPFSRVLPVPPLSAEGVNAAIHELLGAAPEDSFAAACWDATGGNPFYLRDLLRPFAESGVAPDSAAVAMLERTGPDSLRRRMEARLSELGSTARRLGEWAAVLGDRAALHEVVALAELDLFEAGQHVERLRAASILAQVDPVTFTHPLVRAAVEATMPEAMVAAFHRRAAALLQRIDAPTGRIMQHMIRANPSADPAVCELLLTEGRAARESGSVPEAQELLARALIEPPPYDLRAQVLLELARAEVLLGRPEADDHLAEAVACAPNREIRVAALADRLPLLHLSGHPERMPQVFHEALQLRPTGQAPDETRLRWHLIAYSEYEQTPPLPAELTNVDLDTLPIQSGEDRMLLLAHLDQYNHQEPEKIENFLRHVTRAVADLPNSGTLTYFETLALLEAAAHLIWFDQLDTAARLCGRAAPEVVRLGAPELTVHLDHRRARIALRSAEFDEVLDAIPGIQERARAGGLDNYARRAYRYRGEALFERGQMAEAADSFDRAAWHPAEHLLVALLRDDLQALPDLVRSAMRVAAADVAEEPVHLLASHAWQRLGRHDAAVEAATAEVDAQRRYGIPSFLALALRRQATLTPTPQALLLLREAMMHASQCPRPHVGARVGLSLGAALRRSGRLSEAREHLRAALDTSSRLGLTRLTSQITEELRLAGGRPRRTRVTGLHSLTASQERVVRLAAAGMSNRQISEELVVTMKTVETHLAAAYRKLQVSSRDELPNIVTHSPE